MGRVRLVAVMVSGALSGLGGICFAYSISANFSNNIYVGYGYLAIAALIFGNWRILPTLGACLLFGFARSGGYRIVQMLENAQQLSGSGNDSPLCADASAACILFQAQQGAPRFG